MCEDFSQSHANHDPKWIYTTDETLACVGCIVQTIEDQQISRLQKTPSIALLYKLIQAPDIIADLKSAPNITCHIIHVVLEALLQTNDTSFISTATDVCLKLVQKLGCEDYFDFMLQDIAHSIEVITSHNELLPMYVLIGRLLQKFPGLSDKFLHHYESMITKLCAGLCCPDEDVLSAIMFIMVYLFEGHWEDHLSPRQLTQLCEDLICVLNSAKTQILMMNSLGLLTKLIVSDNWVHILMTMTVNSLTLLSILKKMIASSIEVVEQLAIQIVSCIIQRDERQEYCFNILQSDLVEFLFEKMNTRNTQNIEHIFKCLLPLCHQEQFYARNHSVYGIEVLLRTLQTMKTMNHYALTKKVLEILSVVFDRQPSKSPLFVNSTTLQLCIDVTLGVVEHSHPSVFLAALKMSKAFLRKEHMLKPIPVGDLKIVLQKMTGKVQTFVSETEVFRKQNSGNKVNLISSAYCEAILSAGKLVIECKKDPTSCLSAFLPPDAVDNKRSTVDSLGDLVVMIISQSSVCLAVSLMDDADNPSHCSLLFQLLNCLQKLDFEEHRNTVIQLTKGALLSKAVSVRCSLGDSHTELQHIDPCLMTWFLLLYQEENKDSSCAGELEIGIKNIVVRLEDLPSHLTHSTLSKDTVFFYSFLLYHCYKNDDIILPSDELIFVLDTFSKEYKNPTELSPFVRKQFVFLWAILTCMTDNVVELPETGLQTVLELVGSCLSSVWYSHHPAILHWAFKDSRVVSLCGQHVLLHWLEEICSRQDDFNDDPDVITVYQMFTDVDFLSTVVTSLSDMNSRTGKLTIDLLENYISQLVDSDEEGMFLLSLTAVTEERIIEIFLDPHQKPEDKNIDFYVKLLMMCNCGQTDDISSSFLKILYHVTSWLDEDKGESTVVSCLHLLCGVMSYSPTRVVNLMVNSYKFMTLINSSLKSPVVELLNASWTILSLIIINTSGLDEKTLKTIELTINPVDDFVHDINIVTPYMQVVSALLQVDFTCPVIFLRNTGRYPPHSACPFTSNDFKMLFIYLQQFVLQDINDVKLTAVLCIEKMLQYLKKYSLDLVSDLLKCSWNKLLMEVLITITVSDLSSLQTTLQLINVILEMDQDNIVFNSKSDLCEQLTDFIKCVNDEDVTNKDILDSIRNKMLS